MRPTTYARLGILVDIVVSSIFILVLPVLAYAVLIGAGIADPTKLRSIVGLASAYLVGGAMTVGIAGFFGMIDGAFKSIREKVRLRRRSKVPPLPK